jgi:hypothetical protein
MSKNIVAAIAALEAERAEVASKLEPLDKMIAHLKKQIAPSIATKPKDKKEGE